MEKANLNRPPLESYNSPPSYDQATGSSTSQPGFTASQYPKPPPGFIPADPFPNDQQPIYPTNYHQQQAPPTNFHQPQAPTNYHQQHAPQQHPQVVIVQSFALPLGPRSCYVTCPHCHMQKLTRVEPEPGSKTHLMAAILCVFGLWCCVCLPYFMNSCMNINHYCGNCNKFLGKYDNGT